MVIFGLMNSHYFIDNDGSKQATNNYYALSESQAHEAETPS